jgi:hypothetical protein
MVRVVVALSVVSALIGAGLLSACAPIDVYAFRAIQYNFEAEETQNQVILLNILRSSLHRPMEFTEITNIVGANSATSNVSFGFPVGPHPASSITTGSAGGSLGGTTTFTIPVLDTQDFYEGLLNDIQPSLLGYYLQTPFVSKELLLNLFVENIVIHVADSPACKHSHATTCERDFRNSPSGGPEDMALFQTFVRYLLSRQIGAEPVKTKPKSQTIKANGATINISGSGSTSSDSSGTGGGGGGAQSTPYRLCFNSRLPGQGVPSTANCGAASPKSADQQIAPNTTVGGILFSHDLAGVMLGEISRLPPDNPQCSAAAHPELETLPHDRYCYQESVLAFAGHTVDVTLQFRSTGSIFNFLGQLVSEEEDGRTYPLYTTSPLHAFADEWPSCWLRPPGGQFYTCKPIIAVQADGGPVMVSVGYSGSIYAVPGDPKATFSPDVFTILKQLVALNLSGKNLPTTAILSVTSP